MSEGKTSIAVFGSTGSIGQSTLDIVASYPEKFKVVALVANSNGLLLQDQISKFKPKYAGLYNEEAGRELKLKVKGDGVEFFTGRDVSKIAGFPDYDILLAAVVGFAGLESTLIAARAGKKICLANKESLVAGGELLLSEAVKHDSKLIPVDSEHSAIFQLLEGTRKEDLQSITLTASGGPFLNRDLGTFDFITPEEAIKHPRWQMGSKISLDSASMFNKALEVIEAKWLFDLKPDEIEVIVHPQSIIHSMINFRDGSTFAQLSGTDMKGPIAYALNYPSPRLSGVLEKLDFSKLSKLEFVKLDDERFPAIRLAKDALKAGKAACAVLNCANEIAGEAFMAGKIRFRDIYGLVNDALSEFGTLNYSNYDDLVDICSRVRGFLET